MSTYKVIQDIEAEDKLLGPLTLKQFLYAIGCVICLYLCFVVLTSGLAIFLPVFLLPALFFGFFAVPWSAQQPTEVWALAKIRFLLKPRKRIWNQSGVKELVTVTAPKRIERIYTNGLSQLEVESRLTALANTLDSRGWAIKNVNVNLFSQPLQMPTISDRLVDPSDSSDNDPIIDIRASDDMLDAQNNPVAQQFDQMLTAAAEVRRQQALAQANNTQQEQQAAPTGPPDYWFMNQSEGENNAHAQSAIVAPGAAIDNIPVAHAGEETEEEKVLAAKLKAENSKPNPSYAHLRTIEPLSSKPKQHHKKKHHETQHNTETTTANNPAPAAVTPPANPAIIHLANNDDLTVSTLSRQANRLQDKPKDDDEVVISLR